MENDTFRLRPGKQAEMIFGAVWFLLLAGFAGWIFVPGIHLNNVSPKDIPGILMLLLILIGTLLFPVLFGLIVWKTRLTVAVDSITYQSAFATIRVPWERVKGFCIYAGEVQLLFDEALLPEVSGIKKRLLGKRQPVIPLAMFTKISMDGKLRPPDRVTEALHRCAPQLFNTGSPEAA